MNFKKLNTMFTKYVIAYTNHEKKAIEIINESLLHTLGNWNHPIAYPKVFNNPKKAHKICEKLVKKYSDIEYNFNSTIVNQYLTLD